MVRTDCTAVGTRDQPGREASIDACLNGHRCLSIDPVAHEAARPRRGVEPMLRSGLPGACLVSMCRR